MLVISVFNRVLELYEQGKPAALATVVESKGSTPRKPGARMIVFPDGSIEGTVGGGAMEKRVMEEALQVIESGDSRLVHISLRENEPTSVGGVCGGELKVFLEKIGSSAKLIIFGAGHVGQTISRMAEDLSLDVVIYDDREEYADPKRFPPYAKVICGPFERAMETLQPTNHDYIVIVTYQYIKDENVLKDALQTPAKYIGMIGSEMKCLRVLDNLRNCGISEEQLAQVHAPIGLSIGAHTPAEVAVSILAQIVQVMNEPS